MKRIWNNERLELNRLLINQIFPKQKVNSLKRMKEIIVKMEKERGETVEEHNKNVLRLNKQDEKDTKKSSKTSK